MEIQRIILGFVFVFICMKLTNLILDEMESKMENNIKNV